MTMQPYGPLPEQEERYCVCCQRTGGECCDITGLREDLGRAEERIHDLEEQLGTSLQRLWDHIGSMPGGI